jgi:hypothetical protein
MASKLQRKNYRLDVGKLNRAKRILRTRTETETIHKALELVADEGALARALKNLIGKAHRHVEAIDE